MKVSHYIQDNLVIVNLQGNLDNTSLFPVNQYLKPVLAEISHKKSITSVIFDLDDVKAINSAGIGLLCGKCVKIKKMGKRFGLCSVGNPILNVLRVCDLEDIFTFYKSAAIAIHTIGTPDIEPITKSTKNPNDSGQAVTSDTDDWENRINNLSTFSKHNKRLRS